jgi:hypothetical protein
MRQIRRKISANLVGGFVLTLAVLVVSACAGASSSSTGTSGSKSDRAASTAKEKKGGPDKTMALGTLQEHLGQDDGVAGAIFYTGEIGADLEVCG